MAIAHYVPLILFLAAFTACLVSIMGKCPLWVPVLFLCLVGLYLEVQSHR